MTIDVQGAAIDYLTSPDEAVTPTPRRFVVLSGHAEGLVESRWVQLGPGDVFNVPSSCKHGWRNLGAEPAVMILISTAKMGRFFAEIAGRSPEHFLATAERYGYWNATPEESAAVGIPFTP